MLSIIWNTSIFISTNQLSTDINLIRFMIKFTLSFHYCVLIYRISVLFLFMKNQYKYISIVTRVLLCPTLSAFFRFYIFGKKHVGHFLHILIQQYWLACRVQKPSQNCNGRYPVIKR